MASTIIALGSALIALGSAGYEVWQLAGPYIVPFVKSLS